MKAASVSSVTSHQACPRKWHLTDPTWGLGYGLLYPESPLFLGDLVHQVLAKHYFEGTPVLECFAAVANVMIGELRDAVPGNLMWEAEKERLEKDLTLAHAMLKGYAEWQAQDLSEWGDANLEFLRVEPQFQVVYKRALLAGTWDGLVRRRDTGQLFLLEHKTARSIDELLHGIAYDLQPQFYVWVASQVLQEPVQGALYNCLQKCDPYNIPLLKSGLPSKAKTLLGNTSSEAYLSTLFRCMEEQGMSDTQQRATVVTYNEFLEELESAPGPFRRHLHLMTPKQLEAARDQVHYAAIQMSTDLAYPPHKNRFVCAGGAGVRACSMGEVCLAIDAGADWRSMLEASFVRRPPRYTTAPELEI